MRLDQALVARGLTESRTEAQVYVERGWVEINGVVVTKNNKTVLDTDTLSLKNKRQFVSRGGDKLLGVLSDVYKSDERIRGHLQGKVALDIGSSTGGFTDCLLQMGVKHIDAVDVGTAQTHISLLNDNRVAIFEGTDIREFIPKRKYDIVVADLSFISLQGTIDTITKLSSSGTECFLLIKPQFEVGKGNTKKGIVKDEDLVKEVLEKMDAKCKSVGGKNISMHKCHIQGGDGNQEYFIYFSY
jgi:23S rRNA (cytidine1920-2'-O)/16S rRNA (cytidine1409-2'-O)-methyltransferase